MGIDWRRRLFEQGCAATTSMGIEEDLYICPICQTAFEIGAIETGDLTEEHVPQKSCGGRPIILTCRRCNNTAGSRFERAAADRQKLEEEVKIFFARSGKIDHVILETPGLRVNAELVKVEDTFDLRLRGNNPTIADAFLRTMSQPQETFSLTSRTRYREDHARIADLKNAFLALTANFGYYYGLNEGLDFVREPLRTGVENFPVRYVRTRQVPANSIFVNSDYEWAIVKFQSAGILMPLPGLTELNFRDLSELGPPSWLEGGYQPMPKNFIAQIDHNRRHQLQVKPLKN